MTGSTLARRWRCCPASRTPSASTTPTLTLTLLADALRERRALHGLCWHDAVNVAAAIAFDCSARYNVADYLALRAIRARDGSDAMPWRDRQAVACAFA